MIYFLAVYCCWNYLSSKAVLLAFMLQKKMQKGEIMAKCRECDGTGVCHHNIHRVSDWVDEIVQETTGSMYTCPDCDEDADNPGDCPACDGTGEVDDDDN